MMLYVIGDTHLSLNTDKSMEIFGGAWDGYVQKLRNGFQKLTDDDICVVCGDITWSMDLENAAEDFRFLNDLPGKKIIVKGNHDYWWSTVSKAKALFEREGLQKLDILNNNCFFYGDTAICGTRGWFYEEETGEEHDKKIMAREIMRLEASLKAAGDAKRKICFLHYPPRFNQYVCGEMVEIMRKYDVRDCYYGHIHGWCHKLAVTGPVEGIVYHDIASDHIGFSPELVI